MNMRIVKIKNLFIGEKIINGKNLIIKECNINIQKSSIDIKCEFKISLTPYLLFNERPTKQKFLFCFGEKNLKISLYDCYICVRKLNVNRAVIEKISIIYNQILIGEHVEDCGKIPIKHVEYIVQNDHNIKIWKNDCWGIKDFKVKIKALKEHQMQITIDSKGEKLSKIFEILNNVIGIVFWGAGYFLNKKKIFILINGNKCEYISTNGSLLETTKFTDINGILVSYYEDWDKVYSKWEKLYNENKMLIHMFWSIPCTKFEEVKTFNYIQCLESLFSNNIISKDISLRKKINEIFEYELSKKIFEREEREGLLENIEENTYNHRNAIAHIDSHKRIFKKEDNRTIQLKFSLLFRVVMLNLLEIEYDNLKLQDYIKYLDSRNFFLNIKN